MILIVKYIFNHSLFFHCIKDIKHSLFSMLLCEIRVKFLKNSFFVFLIQFTKIKNEKQREKQDRK